MAYGDKNGTQKNTAIALAMGLKLHEGAVTKTEGAEWVRVTPYRNFDPRNNIEHAREALDALMKQREAGDSSEEEHF